MAAKSPIRSRGRPRNFDTDVALQRAMKVFWRKGYQGASLTDLTRAMGINRPSLYAAFGNKESLFRQALEHYVDGPASYIQVALAEPTARRVASRLLEGAVELLANPRNPRGCLVVQGALACGSESDGVRQQLASVRAAGVASLRNRLKRAKDEGDLPKRANPADLARFLAAVIHGMAVQAASGATRRDLRRISALAMRTFETALPASR